MPKRSRKAPKDINLLAAHVVEVTAGPEPPSKSKKKNPAAVALGRLGGLKGGKARAKKLTSEKKKDIAKKAAKARWERYYAERSPE